MDSSEKAELIRRGNAAFNSGNFREARDLFVRADYRSGLERIGDYFMYERRLPLLAYGYYKRARAGSKIEDLHRRMVGALGEWIGKDKIKPTFFGRSSAVAKPAGGDPKIPAGIPSETDADGLVPVRVNPMLREMAQRIAAGKDRQM